MSLSKNAVELQRLMDEETYNHCCNVKRAAVLISKEMNLDCDVEILENASAVLDIGKLMINNFVFQKAEPLSGIERELMDLHSYLGYRICLENGISDKIAQVVLYHHGRDKPYISDRPMLTEEIKKYAEIVHTIDVYEALTEERGYRERYSKDEACKIMEDTAEEECYRMDILEQLYELDI